MSLGQLRNRKRRCGWFDVNLVKQTAKISGVNDIVINKIRCLR